MIFPHHEMSFDGNWFLRILVPPIVFEAALGIDKRSFNRHVVPIIMYAVGGTLIATLLTALIVHRGSLLFPHFCSPIPFVEALTFGALISSIDPIAVLSVLSNMGMTDTDTIYVVIFGESLLNDGVAIVLFETLIHFLDENLVIDGEAIFAASVHFVVVAFGSLLVGVGSGMMATVYYWLFHGCQTALVEVLMFFCWALLPYYVCDGIGWSGIVCAVATGFVMDIYVVGEKTEVLADDSGHSRSDQEKDSKLEKERYGIFSTEGHLSEESRTHIGFVTQMIATVMETAIFAYLGLFLFSHRYHWNVFHTVIAIIALCVSRAIMIPALSLLANAITRIQQTRAACRNRGAPRRAIPNAPAGVVIDRKMQIVLWFAGLRGAVSFALVERLSLYDSTTGEGTRLKPELKAMTSASILFSVFGGSTYYVMEKLGLAPPNPSKKGQGQAPNFEMKSLVTVPKPRRNNEGADTFSQDDHDSSGVNNTNGASAPFRRQRVQAHANSD
jgi:NhaP-type Na+/H+ or K+/H+ antiporter